MVYITDVSYKEVCKNAPISFRFSDGTYLDGYFFCDYNRNYFISIDEGQSEVFKKLEILGNKDNLFKRTCGYNTEGMWPIAKTKEDCLKFLEALKWVNVPVEPDSPAPATITTTDVIISVPKKKHVKLNFNIQ